MLYTARNGAPTRWKQHFLSLTTKETNDPLCANQPFFYQTSTAASMPCHLDGDTICLPHSHPFWKHVAKVHCSKWQHMFKVRLYILAAKEHPWQSTLQLCPRGVWVLFLSVSVFNHKRMPVSCLQWLMPCNQKITYSGTTDGFKVESWQHRTPWIAPRHCDHGVARWCVPH